MMRTRTAAGTVATAALLLGAAGAHGQAASLAARRDTRLDGTTRVVPALPLHSPAPFTVAADEWQQARQPRRQTRRFATWGAIGGGVAGALAGGWMALYCSSGSGDSCWPVFPLMTGFGAAAGGIGGAIIGAAVPGPGATGAAQPIGSASVSAGIASGSVSGLPVPAPDGSYTGERTASGSGVSARANVYAELTPWLALGPELGIAHLDGDAGDVRHVAVAARISGRRGRVMPFATVNAGAYDSARPSLEYLGGGIGAGARLHPSGSDRFFLDVEARYARNLQNIEPMRLRGLSVSGGLSW